MRRLRATPTPQEVDALLRRLHAAISQQNELLSEAGAVFDAMRATLDHRESVRFETPGPLEAALRELDHLVTIRPRLEAAIALQNELLFEAEAVFGAMRATLDRRESVHFDTMGPLEVAFSKIQDIESAFASAFLRPIE